MPLVYIRGFGQWNWPSPNRVELLLQQRPAGLAAIGECGLDGAIEVPMSLQITMLENSSR